MTALAEKIKLACSRAGQATSDFDLNPGIRGGTGALRQAAVLILISDFGAEPVVTLTKRSAALKHHPGQIAFPGGKVDAADAGVEAAAMREANEEIGLPLDGAEILGRLRPHHTVTSFSVEPVVAKLARPFEQVLEPGEVAEAFDVPLAHILDPANYAMEGRRWQGQMRRYYVVPFGPYYIWGATARMLRALAEAWEP